MSVSNGDLVGMRAVHQMNGALPTSDTFSSYCNEWQITGVHAVTEAAAARAQVAAGTSVCNASLIRCCQA